MPMPMPMPTAPALKRGAPRVPVASVGRVRLSDAAAPPARPLNRRQRRAAARLAGGGR
jgi:hypothetical protein